MTDESRGSPLPQRERGATEAGARPAPARVGAPALPDDLRQRMKASVDAERAQNRERAAEMLRHPPQRLVGGERPRGDAQDRRPNPLRKRFGKGDRTRTPETTPDSQAPIVDNGPPVNSPPAEFLSRTNVSPSAPPLSTPAARETPPTGNTGLASPTGNGPSDPASPVGSAGPTSHTGPKSYASPAGNTGLANLGRAQPVSPLPPSSSSRPPAAGVDLFTPPTGSPSAPAPAPGPAELPSGHPSGPSATSSAQAPPAPPIPVTPLAPPAQAAPSTPAVQAAPAVTPTARGSRRWVKLGLVAGVLAVLAAGSAGLIVATSGSKTPKAVVVGPVQQATVAGWVESQIDPATVVSCDPAMCAALVAHHYPSKNVRDLSSPAALKASGVVVVTPVALQLFGSSLVTAWAPAALATFGSGSSTVSVRIVAPHGATAYEQAARKDQAVRALSEAALTTGSKSITVTGAAAQELNSGQIDGRLFEALAAAAFGQPIDIVDFGNAGSGASANVPLRYADLAASNPTVGLSGSAYVQTLRTSMAGSPGPRPARTQLLTLPGGQQVLRVEYLGPSRFGVLGNS
jgi:hypothetical protein